MSLVPTQSVGVREALKPDEIAGQANNDGFLEWQ
ncbi:hypothetical protein M947_06125 [Sulfurimonas hongkongensis]|uniref:Uncharacterized protein n=1 Tax=Sulfurimonas hongkongensis TaxID=1172190 RepID=T0JN46_9BACT|nr:hypothetical protein M947_06125 [Sulfurimonas hongkongensis]